jgi:hypothetical protein
MRNFIKTFLLLAVTGVLGVTSCTKVCDIGYEGPNCDSLVRGKYLGFYMGDENCGSSGDSFNVALSAVQQDPKLVLITNIYNANNLNAYATVLANGSLTIALQEFGTGTISGDLTLSGGKPHLNYRVNIPGQNSVVCSWTAR